jgi:hypothetical protein
MMTPKILSRSTTCIISSISTNKIRPIHSVFRVQKNSISSSLNSSPSGGVTSTTSTTDYQPGTGVRGFTTINNSTPYNLCFLRHGQSTWNRDNR